MLSTLCNLSKHNGFRNITFFLLTLVALKPLVAISHRQSRTVEEIEVSTKTEYLVSDATY